MSYDRDFCSHSDSCANVKCRVRLDMIKYEADCKKDKFEYPVSHADFKTPECGFIQKTISEINTNDKKVEL